MRVKFGNRVFLCTASTHTEGSKLLLITTLTNGVYTVDCETKENADYCHKHLLKTGWCDFSDYQYSN